MGNVRHAAVRDGVLDRRIAEALDPTRAPSKVRTLADMSPEERASMAALYGRGSK